MVDGATGLLAGLDVYAQPSRREGRSLSMLEAMAASLPTIAQRLPAVSELHPDGSTAVLVPPEDTEALGRAIRELVLDPARRRALGLAARARVAAFSMETMVEAYVPAMARVHRRTGMTRVIHLRSGHGLYGAERSLLALAAATQSPFEPLVASLVRPGREDALGDAARRLGVQSTRIEAPGRLSWAALGPIVRLARGALLHAHDYKSLVLALAAGAVARAPVVATFHGDTAHSGLVRAYEGLARRSARWASAVAATSRVLAEQIHAAAPSVEVHVIPNGIALGRMPSEAERTEARACARAARGRPGRGIRRPALSGEGSRGPAPRRERLRPARAVRR